MDSIRVKRLRCLADTGYIQLKPITVLLGQNSSGKSTFLRILPLLKQSVESRTTGPILWSGRLVDFGNFDDAHQNDSEDNIAFSFNFEVESRSFPYRDYPYYILSEEARIVNKIDISLTLEISKDKEKETTTTSRIFLQLDDSKIQLDFGDDEYITNFFVNSFNVLSLGNKYVSKKFDRSSLLPTITETDLKKEYDFEKLSSRFRRLDLVLDSELYFKLYRQNQGDGSSCN
jgi:AAA15 family ATPase/GTPase